MRLINGLEKLTTGRIVVDGRQSIELLGFTSTKKRPPPSNILYDSARDFALRISCIGQSNLSFISQGIK